MPTSYTTTPSHGLPGQIIGAPISHLPWVFCCSQGDERFCGWAKAANSQLEALEVMTEKRKHEENCQGGLIVVGG